MRMSLRDGSEGDAEASVWLELDNPANFLTFTSHTIVISKKALDPPEDGAKYSLELNTQADRGIDGNFTRVVDMGFSAGGLAQKYIVERYRNGMLMSRSNPEWKSVFGVTKCA
jgi:hypothetical protein